MYIYIYVCVCVFLYIYIYTYIIDVNMCSEKNLRMWAGGGGGQTPREKTARFPEPQTLNQNLSKLDSEPWILNLKP